jgi:outer membrane beta-barrel protein
MENRTQHFLLIGLLSIACNSWAQQAPVENPADRGSKSAQVIEPDVQRRTLDMPKIDSQNFEIGIYGGVLGIQDFGSNPVVGASLTYHVTEDFFLEADYGRSKGDKTSFEKLSGAAELLTAEDRKYSYYSVSVGWNVLPGEVFIGSHYAFNSALYLIGGIGGTKFAGDSAFTANFGVGYRLLLTDWFAWHIDARDYLFERNIFGESERSNNLELRTGVSFFF